MGVCKGVQGTEKILNLSRTCARFSKYPSSTSGPQGRRHMKQCTVPTHRRKNGYGFFISIRWSILCYDQSTSLLRLPLFSTGAVSFPSLRRTGTLGLLLVPFRLTMYSLLSVAFRGHTSSGRSREHSIPNFLGHATSMA